MTKAEKMAEEWIANCIEEQLIVEDAIHILIAGIAEVAERTREECVKAIEKHDGSSIQDWPCDIIRNARWEDEDALES